VTVGPADRRRSAVIDLHGGSEASIKEGLGGREQGEREEREREKRERRASWKAGRLAGWQAGRMREAVFIYLFPEHWPYGPV
jgi:hypothetical protein